jgi:hypothetical protein
MSLSQAAGAIATSGALLYGSLALNDYYNLTGQKMLGFGEPGKIDYPGDRDMFNGLDAMGGDGTKYKEAIRWFQGVEDGNKWKAILACTILLEKPTGVALGGFTGPQKQKIRALENRKSEALSTLKTVLATYQTTWSSAPDDQKRAHILTALQAVMTYIWVEKVDLEDPDSEVQFSFGFSHTELMIKKEYYDGLTANMDGVYSTMVGVGNHYANVNLEEIAQIKLQAENVRFHREAADYLPMLTDSEVNNRDEADKKLMEKTRADWPDYFKRVNVSRAKIVALLALQYQPKFWPIQYDWYVKYSGRPHKAKTNEKMNNRTKEIWNQVIASFLADKKLYHKDAKRIFGTEWYNK